MSPELMILVTGLFAQRDRKGPKWCRSKGVGEIRRRIGPENLTGIAEGAGEDVRRREDNRREAARILSHVCGTCGQCRLGREAA